MCSYVDTRRLLHSAAKLASYDIVLTTHNLLLWDSPLKTERALFQCACCISTYSPFNCTCACYSAMPYP